MEFRYLPLGGLCLWKNTIPLHCEYVCLSVCLYVLHVCLSVCTCMYMLHVCVCVCVRMCAKYLSVCLSCPPLQPSGEVLENLEDGYLMDPPDGCPGGIYDIMCHCWEMEPQDRPNFPALQQMLQKSFGMYLRGKRCVSVVGTCNC